MTTTSLVRAGLVEERESPGHDCPELCEERLALGHYARPVTLYHEVDIDSSGSGW